MLTKNLFMSFILSLICSLLIHPAYSKIINRQTDSFSNIDLWYQQLKAPAKNTLMVFDLDDTILTMSQPLGSVGWWDWQYKLQTSKEESDKLFTHDFQQLTRIQNFLFQLIKMEPTDNEAIPFIQNSSKQGAATMILTARGKEYISTTLTQLQENDVPLTNTLSNDFHCPSLNDEIMYQAGVLFLKGQDKGKALLCILEQSKQEINTILFVDDSPKNIESINTALAKHDEVQVLSVLYTKEHAKEQEVEKNPELQAQILEQWTHIKSCLNKVIVQSYF